MLESAAMRAHRHPRVGGDPLVFEVFKVKMDSRFHGNDERGVGVKGRGVFNE
jgi:hypothetical protein